MAEPYTVLPLSALRKAIAMRMTELKRTIPHFRLSTEIEIDALLAVRSRWNSLHPDQGVSINDCLVKACATALVQHPAVNCQLHGGELHRYHQADISVVVAIAGGLST